MRVIRLYGSLGKEFGREFKLDVRTPMEALQALAEMVPGFRDALRRIGEGAGLHVRVGREFRGDEEVELPCSRAEEIRLIPATTGSAAGARIVVGAVAMIVGAYFGQPWLVAFGASLALGGISEMLAPKPKMADSAEQDNGYTFSGVLNTAGQGGAVPLFYGGPLLVSTRVISANISNGEPDITWRDGVPAEAPADDPFDDANFVGDGGNFTDNSNSYDDGNWSWTVSDEGTWTGTAPDGSTIGGEGAWGTAIGGSWGSGSGGSDDTDDTAPDDADY